MGPELGMAGETREELRAVICLLRGESGLPVWIDLHVHPVTRTSWPADSRVLFERRSIETGTLSFDQLNASGPSAQLLVLRDIAASLSAPSSTSLSEAVTSYLDLVEATLQ
jgi:hypothetical protein